MDVYKHIKLDSLSKDSFMIVSAKDSQIINNNLLRGDILFTPSSETAEDIGHSAVIYENLESTIYSYHLLRFRPTVNLDIVYSNYFCNDKSVRNQIIKFATGATRFTVSVNNFSNIIVKLPSIEEQHKIGKILSVLENKCNYENKKLRQFNDFKKALMQQLFV